MDKIKPSPCVILTSFPTSENAKNFGRRLVEQDLVNCVTLLAASESIYRYKGQLHQESETFVILKTTSTKVANLEAFFHENHPYEVFEFLILYPEASEKFANWLRE